MYMMYRKDRVNLVSRSDDCSKHCVVHTRFQHRSLACCLSSLFW